MNTWAVITLFSLLGMLIGAAIALWGVAKGSKISISTMIKVLSMSPDEMEAMKKHFEGGKKPDWEQRLNEEIKKRG